MRRSLDPVLLFLLAASLATNVLLYRRVPRELPVAPSPLAVGQLVPPLEGRSLAGTQVRIDILSRPTIVYLFSPACGWSQRNLENAKAVAVQTSGSYRFVAVTLDERGIAEYVRREHLGWQVLTSIPDELRKAYRFSATPQTVVIGSDGRVQASWSGAYRGTLAAEVERVLGVRLPGLGDASSE